MIASGFSKSMPYKDFFEWLKKEGVSQSDQKILSGTISNVLLNCVTSVNNLVYTVSSSVHVPFTHN